MPGPHPKEFRGDAPIAQIAKGFGISDSCLRTTASGATRLALVPWAC